MNLFSLQNNFGVFCLITNNFDYFCNISNWQYKNYNKELIEVNVKNSLYSLEFQSHFSDFAIPIKCDGYRYLATHRYLDSEDFHTLNRIVTNAIPFITSTPNDIEPRKSYPTEERRYSIGFVMSNSSSLLANYMLFINLNASLYLEYDMKLLILHSNSDNKNCIILSQDYNKDSELLKNLHFDLIIMNDLEKEFYLLLLFQQRYSEIQMIIGDYYNIDLPALDYVIINDRKDNKAFDEDDIVSNNHYQLLSFSSHIFYNPLVKYDEKRYYAECNLDENKTYAITYLDDIFSDEYFETLIVMLKDIPDLDIILIINEEMVKVRIVDYIMNKSPEYRKRFIDSVLPEKYQLWSIVKLYSTIKIGLLSFPYFDLSFAISFFEARMPVIILNQDDFNSNTIKKILESSLLYSLICDDRESYINVAEYVIKNNVNVDSEYYSDCLFNNRVDLIGWSSLFTNLLKPPIIEFESNFSEIIDECDFDHIKDNDELYDMYFNKTLFYVTHLPSSNNLLKSFININSIGRAKEAICFLPYLYDIDPNNDFIIVVANVMTRKVNTLYSLYFFEKMINDVNYLEEEMVHKLYLSYVYVVNLMNKVDIAFKIITDSTILKPFNENDKYDLICLSAINITIYDDNILIDAFLKSRPNIKDRNAIRFVLHHFNKYQELSDALLFYMINPKYVNGLETYCDDIFNEVYPSLPSFYKLAENRESNSVVHIHLIIQYFKPKNKKREEEVNTCLMNNLQQSNIFAIHTLNEEEYDFSSFPNKEKIRQVVIGKRLSLNKAMKYAEENIMKNDIVVIANSDIYYDETIKLLLNVNFSNIVIALSRWQFNHSYPRSDSQDSWIFKNPIKSSIMNDQEIKMGFPGCDQRFVSIVRENGLECVNFGFQIHSFHLHSNFSRDYDELLDRIKGDYDFVTNYKI